MTEAYLELLGTVQLVSARWRLRRVTEGILATAAATAGVLLLGAAADWLLAFGRAGRLVLALACWTTLLATVWRLVLRPAMAAHHADFFAALVEQRFPTLANRFINALQLGRQDDAHCPRLIEAIVHDGLEAIEQVDPARAVARPATRRSLGAAGAAGAAFALFLLLLGPAARTSVARILLPGADIQPYTRTTIRLLHERRFTMLEGEPLTITAQTAGEIPAEAHLSWADAQDRRGRVTMQPDGASFSYTFPAVSEPFEFRISAGDARSHRVQVDIEPRPRVMAMAVEYRSPAYTALAPRAVDPFDGHLHGLAQTRAALAIGASKPLQALVLRTAGGAAVDFAGDQAGTTWTGELSITASDVYRLHLTDRKDNQVVAPTAYTISLEIDGPPAIRFVKPGRDLQCQPEDSVMFQVSASDDLGLGAVALYGRVNDAAPQLLHAWALDRQAPPRRAEPELERPIAELGLKPGDRLEYWAVAEDLNPTAPGSPAPGSAAPGSAAPGASTAAPASTTVSASTTEMASTGDSRSASPAPAGAGRAQTARFQILVLSEEQARTLADQRASDYGQVVAELIRLQRQNRAETAALLEPPTLATRQGLIRRNTLRLADLMAASRFPAQSIVDSLNGLAIGPMAQVLGALEGCRDARDLATRKELAEGTLAGQDAIIESLEQILLRLSHQDRVKQVLRKTQQQDPAAHRQIAASLEKLAQDLDKFLLDVRELGEDYEKIAKRPADEAGGENLKGLEDVEHRLDRWKQWHKDSVDEIAKLPEGFVKESHLKDDLDTIFEEIEKKARPATVEIATPVEEGAKMLGTTVMEDLEIWMMDIGDNLRWVMEEPPEGKFQVPPLELPESLQDMIGDLIEDVAEFDEEADDMTSSWGGNMTVAGWDVMDGPISVFSAQGKTGNQLPNTSELTGRSGGGRRGRSSGQMVGSESRALEGRPTPARLTKEPYEEGVVDATRQLDPRGATGGGRKTGGGQRGLQGGTPPDVVQDMERLARQQVMLREKTMQLAREFNVSGRSPWRLDRAAQLLQAAGDDLQDRRYEDAARKRKVALGDLRAAEDSLDEAVSLSLDRARRLPPELRKEISAGTQQPLPEGFEEIVGAYYRALSESAAEPGTAGERR